MEHGKPDYSRTDSCCAESSPQGPKDFLHLACAIEAKSEYFLTTDKILIKKAKHLKEIRVMNPLEFITLLEEK
ncbi:PIN domain-containing protein [Desulfonema limicola]|uniref:PIN domain-containing protein n=1 Tax=Desulfonema limicola TaxID=45656 RepID=A0A975B9N0_9BACT|nr:PIN domain-containing protein [Desulfonema limicola]